MNTQKAWEEYDSYYKSFFDDNTDDCYYYLTEEQCIKYGLDTSFWDYVRTWPVEEQKELGYIHEYE